eukprot:IDg22311t1
MQPNQAISPRAQQLQCSLAHRGGPNLDLIMDYRVSELTLYEILDPIYLLKIRPVASLPMHGVMPRLASAASNRGQYTPRRRHVRTWGGRTGP